MDGCGPWAGFDCPSCLGTGDMETRQSPFAQCSRCKGTGKLYDPPKFTRTVYPDPASPLRVKKVKP